jgi:pseudouridine-5'-monophosphatase
MSINKVSHVIFDMDGLLLDTEHIYEGLVRDVAKMYNKPYPWDTRIRILGTTEQMTAKIAVKELQLPITVDEFRHKFSELARERLRNVTWLRGAERLLKHLHDTNVPFCLATSSSKEIAEIKMANHTSIFDLFHHKVMGSTDPDVKIGKPAPDIFLVAAKRFPDKPDPANCLVFEDAPNGVRAACSAGMQSVMVPDKMVAEELRNEATIVIDSLEDFQPELFGLPPFPTVA